MESFVFYESFYEDMARLSDEEQHKLLVAIIEYGIYEKEDTELPGYLWGMYNNACRMIREQKANRAKHREAGAKGGRPKKHSQEEPNETKQNQIKPNDKVSKDNDTLNGKCKMVNVNGSNKENIKEKVEEAAASRPHKNTYGEFNNVLLTEDEYSKLLEKLGEEKRTKYIEDLSYYLYQHPKQTYKDHYRVCLKWSENDKSSTNTGSNTGRKFDPNKNLVRSGEDYDEAMRRNIERGRAGWLASASS